MVHVRLRHTIGIILLVMAVLLAGCGDDSADTPRADQSTDSHPIYPKSVIYFGHSYNCIIYSHASAEDGGLWCERANDSETGTTLEDSGYIGD
jgi:hypothetical protein